MYLYGASGHAKVIIDILKAVGEPINGLIDDNPEVEQLQGIPVEHGYSGQTPLIISIGSNFVRKKIANKIGKGFGTAVHPSAIVSPTSRIGEGSVVMQGAIVQAEANIGRHCIINTGASVDHECKIDDYVHISPHATLCGNVSVGEGSWVGAGSTIVQGVTIGKWSVIGAGTIVARNVPDGVLVVGDRMQRIRDITPEMLNKLNRRGIDYLNEFLLSANECLKYTTATRSVIIGAGTYGEVYLAYLQEAGIEIVGFLDDNKELHGKFVKGVPVLGGTDLLESLKESYQIEAVYCPIGNNKLRVKVLSRADKLGYAIPNFIHESVLISPNTKIGEKGVYILPSTVIMPYTTIDNYVMISMNAKIAHHSVLKEGTFISTGVNFGASIVANKYSYIGISATIMTGVKTVGEDCLIGAGAVVIKDVPDKAVMAGVPAKVLRIKS